jgi:hypothetical protein
MIHTIAPAAVMSQFEKVLTCYDSSGFDLKSFHDNSKYYITHNPHFFYENIATANTQSGQHASSCKTGDGHEERQQKQQQGQEDWIHPSSQSSGVPRGQDILGE